MKGEEQQRILSALQSSVVEIRHQAVLRLAEVTEEPPVEVLLKALGDESWRVRKCVSDILIKAKPSEELVASLIGALGEEDNAGLRNSASEVLVQMGAPAVPSLIRLLKDGNKDERKLAADILGNIRDRRARDELAVRLKDPDENVRAAAAEALGRLGDPTVSDILVQTLLHDELVVQLSALDALEKLEATVAPQILTSFLSVVPLRPHLYRLLSKHQDPGLVSILIEGLCARGKVERSAAALALVRQHGLLDKQRRVEILVAVARVASDSVVEHLKNMLYSALPEERQAAVKILGWTGREDVITDLIHAISDERLQDDIQEAILSIGPKSIDWIHRILDSLGRLEKVMALNILGHFESASGLAWVVDLCLSEEPEVSEAAQQCLAQIGNPSVVPTLAELITRTGVSSHGVVSTLITLGSKFHDDVVTAVRSLLGHTVKDVRIEAAEIFCGIARKSELEDVIKLVGDEVPEIRVVAVRALGRIGNGVAVAKLRLALTDEHTRVRAEAAHALGSRDDAEARGVVAVALGDQDPVVVIEALGALGRSGDIEMAKSIVPFSRHPLGAVAIEAVRALNRIGWRGDSQWLFEVSRHPDPEVVKEVLAGCERWPEADVRQILIWALNSPHWDVRTAAVRKIGTFKDPTALQIIYEKIKSEEDEIVRDAMAEVLELGKIGFENK